MLFDLDIPVVAFDRVVSDDRVDAVTFDNREATRATEHLLWLGHKRIAYVGGRPDVGTGAERLEGYVAAMRAAQLTPFTLNSNFRAEVAEPEVASLLRVAERPTALVVANNLMASGPCARPRGGPLEYPSSSPSSPSTSPPLGSCSSIHR